MSVDRSLIISNTAEFQGGGIYVPGRLTVQYSTLAANIAGAGPPAGGPAGRGDLRGPRRHPGLHVVYHPR